MVMCNATCTAQPQAYDSSSLLRSLCSLVTATTICGFDLRRRASHHASKKRAKPRAESSSKDKCRCSNATNTQQCQHCDKSYSEHWCVYEWHMTSWSTCEGCGDVLQLRNVDCRCVDNVVGNRIRACTQTTLSPMARAATRPALQRLRRLRRVRAAHLDHALHDAWPCWPAATSGTARWQRGVRHLQD